MAAPAAFQNTVQVCQVSTLVHRLRFATQDSHSLEYANFAVVQLQACGTVYFFGEWPRKLLPCTTSA